MKLLAKTFYGLEEVLAEELQELGAQEISVLKRAVSFEGDKEMLYKANLCLRTAVAILKPVEEFTASDDKILYEQASKIDWSQYLDLEQTFSIDATVFSTHFNHSKYVALKTKDAIVDQFRNKHGKRPDVDTQFPDIRINLHVNNDQFTVSLNSSGEPLNRRGYRQAGHEAPINEILAVGMLKLAGWTPEIQLVDPMCGSGTFLLEAAMITRNIPPGMKRADFSFMHWPDYDHDLWTKVYNEAVANINTNTAKILGSDMARRAVEITRTAAKIFEVDDIIKLEAKPFKRLAAPEGPGLLMMNPPYGERLNNDDDIAELYTMIGDTLKKSYSGYDAWILSSNMDALKHIGLRASKKMTLMNGALECKFQKFSMYDGTKKTRPESDEMEIRKEKRHNDSDSSEEENTGIFKKRVNPLLKGKRGE